MKQEEKQLLLIDLCARLTYNVKVGVTYNKEHGSSNRLKLCSEGCLMLNINILNLYIEDEIYLKPYLRPMPSMTKDERALYFAISEDPVTCIDWLNEHYLDYRGLIEKGLALEAPEDMYNI